MFLCVCLFFFFLFFLFFFLFFFFLGGGGGVHSRMVEMNFCSSRSRKELYDLYTEVKFTINTSSFNIKTC